MPKRCTTAMATITITTTFTNHYGRITAAVTIINTVTRTTAATTTTTTTTTVLPCWPSKRRPGVDKAYLSLECQGCLGCGENDGAEIQVIVIGCGVGVQGLARDYRHKR